jgi:hypothetical protein
MSYETGLGLSSILFPLLCRAALKGCATYSRLVDGRGGGVSGASGASRTSTASGAWEPIAVAQVFRPALPAALKGSATYSRSVHSGGSRARGQVGRVARIRRVSNLNRSQETRRKYGCAKRLPFPSIFRLLTSDFFREYPLALLALPALSSDRRGPGPWLGRRPVRSRLARPPWPGAPA